MAAFWAETVSLCLFEGVTALAGEALVSLKLIAGADGLVHQHGDAEASGALVIRSQFHLLGRLQKAGLDVFAQTVEALDLQPVLLDLFLGFDTPFCFPR